MRKPAIRRSTVPVLYAHRDIYYIAGAQLLCRFAPFLVKPSASHTDEDLSAAVFRMMNVPVVAAAGFKGHIVNTDLLCRKRCEIGHVIGTGRLTEDIMTPEQINRIITDQKKYYAEGHTLPVSCLLYTSRCV